LGKSRQLAVPLGKWCHTISQVPGWFTDETGEQLYQMSNAQWTSYVPIPSRRCTRTFHLNPCDINYREVPQGLQWATTYSHGRIVTLTGQGPIASVPQETISPIPQKFWEAWQCEYFIDGQAEVLVAAIQQGSAVAVSDGSFQFEHGAAAWTIESSTSAHRIRGAGQMPGGSRDQSAYRSELFGLWGILYSLKRFLDEHQVQAGHVKIACDGLTALRKAKAQQITEPCEKHYDIISAIRNLCQLLPLSLTFFMSKGIKTAAKLRYSSVKCG